MKKSNGFGLIYVLAAIVIVGAVATAAILINRHSDKNKNNSPPKTSNSASTKSQSTATDPYAGWRTYTSTIEKANFRYPSDWSSDSADQYASNDSSNSDYTALKSPDGKVVIHWTSVITGFGNEAGQSYPLHEVVDKTPLKGAPGFFAVSGVSTLDGTTYYPWVAAENDSAYGILSSGVQGSLDLFLGVNNVNPTTNKHDTALFSTSGPRVNQGAPALTKEEALSFLTSDSMKQAKQVILSLSYQ